MTEPHRIRWRVHVLARDATKARRVAERLQKRLDRELHVDQVERYWKIPEQQLIHGWTPIVAGSFADAVVEALQLAGRIVHGTWITTPREELDGQWSFDGTASEFSVAGVVFLAWQLERAGAAAADIREPDGSDPQQAA